MAEEPTELEGLRTQLTQQIHAIYEARGIPTPWRDVTPDVMRDAFEVHFRALPSPRSGYAGADEAERLIHDPLAVLREAGIYRGGDEIPDISTFVVNHQHTLNRMVMYASVTISQNPHTIGITLVKEPLPAELRELAAQIDTLQAAQEAEQGW
jgi:hypothetical protein